MRDEETNAGVGGKEGVEGYTREKSVQGQGRKTAIDKRKSTCNKVKA